MSPALRQSWRRWKASPALPEPLPQQAFPAHPRRAQGAGSCSPVTAPEGLRVEEVCTFWDVVPRASLAGHVEAQRRGRSSGDELILSWAKDHKPETLSNGPRCVLSQFRWDNSREQQEADLVSMARCGSGASSPAFLTHFLEKPGLHQGTREPGPECKGDGYL